MTDLFYDLPGYDTGQLISVLWDRWLALLDRYDGRSTAANDPAERAQVHLELLSQALLLCAIPAPGWEVMHSKTLIAAWLRDHGADTWTSAMVEIAVARDTLALQPSNDLAV